MMKRLLIILFISLWLLPIAVFADDTDKPIEVAWNFGFNFTFGRSSSGGTPATYFVLLPSSTDKVLLPSSTDKMKLPGH
jgi:hypothetical protein